MATKKSASKKAAGTDPVSEKPAAKKAAAKKTAATTSAAKKTAPVQAAATEHENKGPATTAKAHPSHHDISVHAYLLWERDGKKHGNQDHYWQQAERELKS